MSKPMLATLVVGLLLAQGACSESTTGTGVGTTDAAATTVSGTDSATTAVTTAPSVGSTTPQATRPDVSLSQPGTIDPTKPTFSTLPRADADEGDPGTVSVSLTAPVAISGWALAPVACSVDRRTYTASFDQAAVNETLAVSAAIKVVNYTDPGTYPAVGSATVMVPGSTYQVPLAANVTIDANLNGTVSVATTLNATAVAFTLTWYCSA